MKMKETIKSYVIKDALFFRDDFKTLPKSAMIYVKSGKLMVVKKGGK